MYAGTVAGGCELLPVAAVQPCPQSGVVLENPAKLAGAAPPLSGFFFAHWASQYVTDDPTAAFLSPITNVPPPGSGVAVGTTTVKSRCWVSVGPSVSV